MNTLKRLALLCTFLCALASPSLAQTASDITIGGTLVNSFNQACANCTFTVTVTRRDGVAVQSAPKTVTANSSGVVSFTLPRKCFATFVGNYSIGRYNWKSGISMFIPDQSSADLVNLQSVEDAAAALVEVAAAPSDATYWTASANSTLSAEVNLGLLTTGLVKITVSGSTATPSTAAAGTDYVAPGGALGTPSSGVATNLTGLPPTTGILGWPANSAGVLTNDGAGNLSWGAGGGGGTWGSITGTLSDQTDLQSALDAKQPLDSDLTSIAALTTTSFGRGLLAETNAASLKTTLSLNNVENTALSTWAGSTNLTTLGTIATGVWNGSVVGSAYGGAGAVSGILKADGLGTVSAAAAGTDYEVPLIFSTGLTRSTNTITVNTSQNIATLSNLTSNGLVTTSGGAGTLGVTVPGTGVLTALGINIGSAGAPVLFNGAGGTPSSITLTNGTGLPLTTGVTGDLPFANFVQAGSAGFVGATGAGDYSHRTPTQVTAALDAFVGDSGSGGTKGLVPAPASGDAAANKYLKADGTWATVSGGGTPGGSDTQLQRNNAGAFGGISGVTSDGTNVTAGSGNLRATSPRITTSIFDANGLAIISLNPTASAVNSLQVTNGATGSPGIVDLAAVGSDSNVRITLTPKGTSGVVITDASANGLVVGPNGTTGPSFTVATNTASAASGITVTGQADGTAPTLTVNSRTQQTNAIAGNGLAITADPAIAGSSSGTAAAGGSITLTAGAAARNTSGNANGGNIILTRGAGIGTGTVGQVLLAGGNGTSTVPALANSGDTDTGIYFPGTNQLGLLANGVAALTLSSTSLNTTSGISLTWNSDIGVARPGQAATLRLQGGTSSTTPATLSTPANSPAQITADQNNYAPGTGWFQRWSSDASRNITGLVAGVDGQIIEIWNVGAQNIVLQNENASSTAANRFTTSTGADLTLTANKCAKARYDTTSARWRAYLCN